MESRAQLLRNLAAVQRPPLSFDERAHVDSAIPDLPESLLNPACGGLPRDRARPAETVWAGWAHDSRHRRIGPFGRPIAEAIAAAGGRPLWLVDRRASSMQSLPNSRLRAGRAKHWHSMSATRALVATQSQGMQSAAAAARLVNGAYEAAPPASTRRSIPTSIWHIDRT
jgi:hypothetical protein